MPITCVNCSKTADPPPAHRVGFSAQAKERVLSSVCAACWKEWEGMEVKVINEYRLNLFEPEHRAALQRACLDHFKLAAD